MTIRIVTHCYAVDVPWYAKALHYQLSSLAIDPPDCDVRVDVFYELDDAAVKSVLDLHSDDPANIKGWVLTAPKLFRRSIGRNLAALDSLPTDIVWFTDCDHLFLDGCLNRLTDWWAANRGTYQHPLMVYPREIKIHKTHEMGDALPDYPDAFARIDPNDFTTKRYTRAIGGVQIVGGQDAMQYGYLPDGKWQKPYEGGHFAQCKCDRAYRSNFRSHDGEIIGIDLPGVYRLRHTQNGRDVGKS